MSAQQGAAGAIAAMPWLAGLAAGLGGLFELVRRAMRPQLQPADGQPVHPLHSIRLLLTLLVVVTALPLAGLLAFQLTREANFEIDKARQSVKGLAEVAAGNAAASLADSRRVALYLSERPQVRALDPDRCDPYAGEFLKFNPHYDNIISIDANGQVICSSLQAPGVARPNVGSQAWFSRLKQSKGFVIGRPQRGVYTGRWISVLAYPIRDAAGAVAGAAAVVINLSTFQPTVGVALPDGGVAGIVDRDGYLVARSQRAEESIGRNIAQTAVGRVVFGGQGGSDIIVGNDGIERFYAQQPIADTGWIAIVGIPTELIYAPARQSAMRNGLWGILILALAVLAAAGIHRRIAAPLGALRDTAQAISAGASKVRAPERGPTEVAEVATTFNRMLDRIPVIENALRESELRYRALFDSSPDAIRVICNNRVVMLNPAAVALYGVASEQEIVGQDMLQALHPDHHAQVRERMRLVMQEQRVIRTDDLRVLRADGSQLPVDLVQVPFSYNGAPAIMSIMRDRSAHQAATRRLSRLAHLYSALSKTNVLIARERDWYALCKGACTIAVEQGGLHSALIRLYDAETATLMPFARHGRGTGALAREFLSAQDSQVPSARAFRDRRPMIINDMADPTIDFAARSDAAANDFRSAGLFPIMWNGEAIGVFAVVAAETGFFDPELAEVFDEMATSIAFAHAKLAVDAALNETAARLTGVVDSAMDAILTVDNDMRVVVFNQAAEAMFRVSAADAIGASMEQFLPARFRGTHSRKMFAYADSGATARSMGAPGEVVAVRRDGEEFPAEASISHVKLGGHHLYTVIMRDITEKTAARRALEEGERRYRSLVENSPSGVVLTAGETIEYANPGMARMLGLDFAEDLIGCNILDQVLPDYRQQVAGNLRALGGEPGRSLAHVRLRMQRHDGAIIQVEAAGASIQIDGRTLVQSEVRDVTSEFNALAEVRALNSNLEQRITERTAALSEANRNLEGANRDLEAFSYSVAHDLSGPARRMNGFASLLAIDVKDGALDRLPSHAERIIDNAAKMTALINGLLNVARYSHGKLANARIELARLVEEVLKEQQARECATLRVEPLPAILGDEATIRQVWTNLVSNALKYSAKRPYPEVSIGCETGASEMVFHVRDNGAGFDPEHSGQLFGVFQRLHHAQDFEGTGVGLAIVRRIVERHGGRVWAEGHPDAGATFYVALPAERLAPA